MAEMPILNLSSVFAGVLFLGYSIIQFQNHRRGVAFFVFLGALFIRLGFGLLEDFPNIWDEQFHALVAKNLSTTPLTPRLYPEAVLPYDFTSWTGNYIWLHKQPWFLWQIALSIKIFGANIFAVRLPSFIMSALMSILIFSIGQKLKMPKAGFWGGLLWAVSFFSVQLNTGVFPTDHNDVAFVFYVTASIWSFLSYLEKPSFKRAALVGVFSGFAVLTKWLVGLSVYLIWAFYILITKNIKKPEVIRFTFSVALTFLIFVPWNIYIFYAFPKEAAFEMAYNSEHFFVALEGHSQSWYFHFVRQFFIYGPVVLVLAILGFISFFKQSRKSRAMLFWAGFVFLFFTIAATKMEAFTYILAALFYLSAGLSIEYLLKKFNHTKRKTILPILVFLLVGWFSLLPEKIAHSHTLHNDFRKTRSQVAEASKRLERESNTVETVAFNVPKGAKIIFMFYTQGVAYDFYPSENDLKTVKLLGKKPLVYHPETNTFETISD